MQVGEWRVPRCALLLVVGAWNADTVLINWSSAKLLDHILQC
jgi:hypothetical protein